MTAARVVRHADAQAFLAAASTLLERETAAYGGLVAWARALREKPRSRVAGGLFWTVADEGRTVAFGLQREQGPLVIGDGDPGAVTLLASAVARRHPGIPGLLGSHAACAAFSAAWRDHTGHVPRLRFRLRSYVLAAPPPAIEVRGDARPVQEADLDLVVAWLSAFIDEVRIPDDKSGLRIAAAARIAAGELWLWHDRRIRALVGHVQVEAGTGRIVTVYTPAEFRGRGYARALTAAVAARLRERGCTRIHLTADCANPASNAVYTSLGFQPAGDHFHYDFVPTGHP